MAAREEACVINEENLQTIAWKYDVPQEALEHRKGDMFVGEIGCDYWYSLLRRESFDKKYQFVSETTNSGMQLVIRK